VITAPPTLPPTAPPASVVLVGAGDIASCALDADEATAELLDGIDGDVFTLGDTAYDVGSPAEFTACYDPTWGRHLDRTHPVPGNHDYYTPGAAGYFGYFGDRAGDPAQGWYSFDLGAWHIVALNSNCGEVGGCGAGSDQLAWLRADLAASDATCTLAMMHHPRFSSAGHGDDEDVGPLWEALYAGGAEIVLAGHDHTYERFAAQDPAGTADPGRGVVQFVVGTGGAPLRDFQSVEPNSESRSDGAHGVLRLTLQPDRYDWVFIPVAGDAFTDAGTARCH
jgi:3',5'-cyclic AMP phosphodiesterase CpdA